MANDLVQVSSNTIRFWRPGKLRRLSLLRLPAKMLRLCVLLALTLVIFCTSLVFSQHRPEVQAADPGAGNTCTWYTVRYGDTLANIAWNYRSNLWTLARVNAIRNVNLIFVRQQLCIPRAQSVGSTPTWRPSGLFGNGAVRWYAYDALEWSNYSQADSLLRQVAAQYGLPANLVLAIAWQESGWTQHVISHDGGIGMMQLMPGTAAWINQVTGLRRDPYKLWDNLHLGATYLSWLWRQFGGDWTRIISAYNQGGYAVAHWGIYNWQYVNNVLALARRFS